MAERADDRVVRLLGIVSFLDSAGPVPVEDLARRFSVSAAQITKDLDALWVTGTPGYFPDDLIDFDAESLDRGVVRLTAARGLTRPLRLGTREAVALVASLRAMRGVLAPGDERVRLVDSVLAKLTEATGEAAAALDVRLAPPGDPAVVQTVTGALARGHRLRIRYVTAADVASEREVDPVTLYTQDERGYLLAWCSRAQGRRTFRLDRVVGAVELDEPADAHGITLDADDSTEYAPHADAPLATIAFAGAARWVAEQVPVESVRELDDNGFEVTLRVTNPVWVRHLLLEQARHVRSVSPAWLVEDVVASAGAALAAYGALPAADV